MAAGGSVEVVGVIVVVGSRWQIAQKVNDKEASRMLQEVLENKGGKREKEEKDEGKKKKKTFFYRRVLVCPYRRT